MIIVNAAKVVLTSGKADSKDVYRHSGYPGGLKRETYADLLARKPGGGRPPRRSGACCRRARSAARCSRS